MAFPTTPQIKEALARKSGEDRKALSNSELLALNEKLAKRLVEACVFVTIVEIQLLGTMIHIPGFVDIDELATKCNCIITKEAVQLETDDS